MSTCGRRKVGFENRPAIGSNSQPCVREDGHSGLCRNVMGKTYEGVPAVPQRTIYDHLGAIIVSDPDPEELALIENARRVLCHAREMLRTSGLTDRELRFVSRTLGDSLGDVLAILDTRQGADSDD